MNEFTISERLAARLNLLPKAVHDAFPAVLFGRVLVIATRIGIFDQLDKKPLSAAEVSHSLNLPEQSAQLLLSSLHAAGYLKKRGARYSLSPQASKWLVKSSPAYLGNFLRYIELLHGRWMLLEESLRKGTASNSYPSSYTPEEWRIYTEGMMDLAKLILPQIRGRLTLPPNAKSILDLGGSHGLYSIDLCTRHPGLTATLADLPPVLERTREIIREHRLSDRITLLPCNMTSGSFGRERYDAVLMFNIVHGFQPDVNRALLAAASGALTTGGSLLLVDQFTGKRSRGEERLLPLMVGINLLNEIGGNVYEMETVRSWCAGAGLGQARFWRLSLPGVGLLKATKI